jgi:ubiquinone/menaquinone biosynthesis C-methylase UbiE
MHSTNPNKSLERWVQVASKTHYDPLTYLHPKRMASIGYQFRLVAIHFPKSTVLEVGVGAGLTALILRQLGHVVQTLDVDARLEPDVTGSVTEIPLKDGQFDVFLCCQVLEHLQWDLVETAICELRRVTRLGGVISVPSNKPTWAIIKHDSRSSGHRRITLGSRRNKPMKNRHGEHHWELESNVTTEEFRAKLKTTGLQVIEEIQPIENLYHHFFVVKKIPANGKLNSNQ